MIKSFKSTLLPTFIAAVFASQTSAQVNVVKYRYDNGRTGANLNETALKPSTVQSGFGKLFSQSVDGEIYGQPLYVSNVTVPGKGTHNIVYVATMNDVVYAFDADSNSGANAAPLWTVSFVNPAAGITPVPITDISDAFNILHNVGIESTPVIDLPSSTMYLVARTKENGAYFQRIHALDITTGAERPNSPVAIGGFVSGTAPDGVNNKITFDPRIHNQRPGLALAGNNLVICWASHEDENAYHGWVMTYNMTSLTQTGIFSSTPNGSAGGIWMAGWAPAVDDSGYFYLTVGNGSWDGKRNLSESMLKFSMTERLAVVDYFTPYDWSWMNQVDFDLGSSGVLLIPGTKVAVCVGKYGEVYLVNTAKMGYEVIANTHVVQWFNLKDYNPNSAWSKSGAVYWNRPGQTSMLYTQTEADYARGFQVVPNGGGAGIPTLDTNVVDMQVSAYASTVDGGGAISLSGDPAGTSAILWSSACLYGTAGDSVCPGVLRAYDASNGLAEIWDSNANSARDSVGNWGKFVPPVVANGKVYLATFSNQLNVYGLLPQN